MAAIAKPTILVTGGAGYLGSHAVLALEASGYPVVILDSLESGHRKLVERHLTARLIVGRTTDRALLDEIFRTHEIGAVMHFAASIAVSESIRKPAEYYRNNVSGTLTLLEAMLAARVRRIVFCSSSAVYGAPKTVPIPEEHAANPISPYAASKLLVEQILDDFSAAYDLKAVSFRCFNAAGADPRGRLGEDHHPETHLIPLVLLAALGRRQAISIFGTDYDTPDGTCVRDYVHVSDLAEAHVQGIEYLLSGGDSAFINLGNGSGFSVREVIETARRVTGRDVPVIERERRPGDPHILVGSSDRARNLLAWQPRYPDLGSIIAHAWQWHQVRHGS